ncbi:MAG: hypothetical protein JWO65_364 [Sphingomonas bacterium]|jgi:hypothetical protein|nr:hypothetical protein [Sphingomonas bacterium]
MARLRTTRQYIATALFFFAGAASAQMASSADMARSYSYADMADLALAAPIAAVVTVHDALRLKGADAVGVPPGLVRFYIVGDVTTLIAGRDGLPTSVSWLADVPMGAANRLPKLKKQKLILLARGVPGKPGTLQLVSRDAQIDWSPDSEARVRAILTEANGVGAPPVVQDVGHAFHVPGSIPGEGETQIFLKTADSRPVSLSILRRPGEDPRWSVALGEMVDDSAAAPKRDTLLWYRLACALPAGLPDSAVADQSPEDAAAARDDYKVVLTGLGACGRLRVQN